MSRILAHPEVDRVIKTARATYNASKRKVHRGGLPEVIRACGRCGWIGNTRAMMKHRCEAKNTKAGTLRNRPCVDGRT